MSEELQNPPVIDLEVLLQPISEESPSGEDLRYSGIYDEIREARRADEDIAQGDWQSELKVADFQKVVELAIPALTSRSKDVQIAAWLSESLVKRHGFIGLRDALKLLAGLQEHFWDTLFPEIDEGDMENRANAISWVDTYVSLAAKGVPITGGEGYSFLDWEDSKVFDFPEDIENLESAEKQRITNLKAQAERQRRVTADMWRKERVNTRRASMETINGQIDECWLALADLNRAIEEKFDRNQMPGLTNFKKSFDQVHDQVKQILAEKRAEEPDEITAEGEEAGVDAEGNPVQSGSAGSGSGAIQGRTEALRRLDEIASFFKRTEPHSPVAYLVQRAVKWGNMPLDSWLQEVIKDQSVLYQLKETLGVGASGESTSEEYS